MQIEDMATVERLWEREDRRRKSNGDSKFPALPEVPAGRYHDPEFFAAEQDRLWQKVWIFAGHVSELPAAGSFLKREINTASVLIVRGKDGGIRAFHNVCQHRGARLLAEERGKVSQINCPYHCWSYGLDGALLFVPDAHDFPGLDTERKRLAALRCEEFRGLIFFTFDADAPPLQSFLGGIAYSLADVPLEQATLFDRITIDAQTNWKCVQDAFSETYHVRYVHAQSVNLAIDQRFTARYTMRGGHSAMLVKARLDEDSGMVNVFDRAQEGSASAAPSSLRPVTAHSQRSYNVFPNLTVPIAENLFPIMAIWPKGIGACTLEIRFMKLPGGTGDAAGDAAVVEAFRSIVGEDLAALHEMQQALSSGAIASLALGEGEQFITNYHQEIDHVIGAENIPASLAMKTVELPHIDADAA